MKGSQKNMAEFKCTHEWETWAEGQMLKSKCKKCGFEKSKGMSKKINSALNKALRENDITNKDLIPEPLDKSIYPDACKHDFINDIIQWKCKKCGLEIDEDDISIILNRFADIENWLNDKEEEYE